MDQISDAAAALNISKPEGPAPSPPAAMFPELSPGRALNAGKTLDETLAELKKSPLFMEELDMDNEEVMAMQALAYDGTPLENALNFKEQGNECFREKRWVDAKEFYGKGVAVLAAEEGKRKNGLGATEVVKGAKPSEEEVTVDALASGQDVGRRFEIPKDEGGKKIQGGEGEEDPDEVPKQLALLEQLYVNRAACHLELRNYRTCTVDCAFALRLNPRNVKAFYRSAKALLAVSRIEEADDACARGLEVDPKNVALRQIAAEIVKKNEEVTAKRDRDNAREAKKNHEKRLLEAAIAARDIKLRSTGKPPDMEDAKVGLVPDPSDPSSMLAFPTLLLYPLHYESDFIKAFNETETLEMHFGYVFPLPWDREGVYSGNGVECYMETVSGGLVKVGKKVPLLKALSGGNVEIVDELVKIFVVPRGKAEGWVREFKEGRGRGRK